MDTYNAIYHGSHYVLEEKEKSDQTHDDNQNLIVQYKHQVILHHRIALYLYDDERPISTYLPTYL